MEEENDGYDLAAEPLTLLDEGAASPRASEPLPPLWPSRSLNKEEQIVAELIVAFLERPQSSNAANRLSISDFLVSLLDSFDPHPLALAAMSTLPLLDPARPFLGRDIPWTALFVALLESSGPEREEKLLSLSAAFAEVAELQVKALIQSGQLHRYAEQMVGLKGVAGGLKLLSNNQLLKFASQSTPKGALIFSDCVESGKSATLEFRHLSALVSNYVPGLNFPLTVVVTLGHHRVLVSSWLPLDSTSRLVCGCSNADKPPAERLVCDASDDERARELIHSLAQTFNLKQHGVSGLRANSNLPSKEEEIQLYTPLDLEVHLAADQRYYLVDTARLCPRLLCKFAFRDHKSFRADFLIHLLRPGFLRSWTKPLSPDAGTNFASERKKEDRADLHEASLHLLARVSNLALLLSSPSNPSFITINAEDRIDQLFHSPQWELNLFFLGHLLSSLPSSPPPSSLPTLAEGTPSPPTPLHPSLVSNVLHVLLELLARAFKNLFRIKASGKGISCLPSLLSKLKRFFFLEETHFPDLDSVLKRYFNVPLSSLLPFLSLPLSPAERRSSFNNLLNRFMRLTGVFVPPELSLDDPDSFSSPALRPIVKRLAATPSRPTASLLEEVNRFRSLRTEKGVEVREVQAVVQLSSRIPLAERLPLFERILPSFNSLPLISRTELALALTDTCRALSKASYLTLAAQHLEMLVPSLSSRYPVLESRVALALSAVYKDLGRVQDAAKWTRRALNIRLGALGSSSSSSSEHPSLAPYHLSFAEASYAAGSLLESYQASLKALDVSRALYGPSGRLLVARALSLVGLLEAQLGRGKFKARFSEAIELLNLAKDGSNRSTLALVLERSARALKEKKEDRAALEQLKEALELRRAVNGKEDNRRLASCLVQLADAQRDLGKLVDAEASLLEAQAILQSLLGTEEHAEVANLYEAFGSLRRLQMGRTDEARRAYQRALDIRLKVIGTEEHADVARSILLLNSVAKSPQLDQLERALKVLVRVFGTEQHPTVADAYETAARIFMDARRYGDAESVILRSIAIRQAIFGDEGSLRNISCLVLLAAQPGGSSTALPLLEKTAKQLEGQSQPEALSSLADIHSRLGEVYMSLRRENTAVEAFEKALTFATKAFAKAPEKLLTYEIRLYRAYLQAERYDEAEVFWPRLLDARASARGPDALSEVATQYHKLAQVIQALSLNDSEQLLKVELLLSIALAVRRELAGRDDDPILAKPFRQLAKLQEDLENYEQAEALWRQTLAAELKRPEIEIGKLMQCYDRIGGLCSRDDRLRDAAEMYEQALVRLRTFPGWEMAECVQYHKLAAIYEKLGLAQAAAQARAKSKAVSRRDLVCSRPDCKAPGALNCVGVCEAPYCSLWCRDKDWARHCLECRALVQYPALAPKRSALVGILDPPSNLGCLLLNLFMIPELRQALLSSSDASFTQDAPSHSADRLSPDALSGFERLLGMGFEPELALLAVKAFPSAQDEERRLDWLLSGSAPLPAQPEGQPQPLLPVASNVKRLFASLELSNVMAVSLADHLDSLRSALNLSRQRVDADLQEILPNLLSSLDASLGSSLAKQLLLELFSGQLTYTTTCRHCGKQSSHAQPFRDLTLSVSDLDLPAAISSLLSPELIRASSCAPCGQVSDASRSASISRLPPYLFLNLARLGMQASNLRPTWSSAVFPFPQQLIFKKDDPGSHARSWRPQPSSPSSLGRLESAIVSNSSTEGTYELVQVLAGHVEPQEDVLNVLNIPYARNLLEGSAPSSSWYRLGSRVPQRIEEESLVDLYGGENECAYVLLYRRNDLPAPASITVPESFRREIADLFSHLPRPAANPVLVPQELHLNLYRPRDFPTAPAINPNATSRFWFIAQCSDSLASFKAALAQCILPEAADEDADFIVLYEITLDEKERLVQARIVQGRDDDSLQMVGLHLGTRSLLVLTALELSLFDPNALVASKPPSS